jgi:hypothetical protein
VLGLSWSNVWNSEEPPNDKATAVHGGRLLPACWFKVVYELKMICGLWIEFKVFIKGLGI